MGAPDPVAREVNGDLLCRRKIPQQPNDRGVGARGLGGGGGGGWGEYLTSNITL